MPVPGVCGDVGGWWCGPREVLTVGAGAFEGSCVPQHVPEGSPSVSLHWGEDVLQGVRIWAGAHEQPAACSEQSTAVSLCSANNEASLLVHNVPSVLSAAQW